MSGQWYTNEDWNDDIEAAFFAKLGRARDKAQYLKIQANVLKSSHPKVSLMLLERYFSIGEKSFHAQAYEIQSAALEKLGDYEGACNALENALNRVKEATGWGCGACFTLPVLIAEHKLAQHYYRAFELLDETEGTAVFPVQYYDWHGARALLLFEVDRHFEARAEATIALEFARIVDSGISRHKGVGLVPTTEDNLGLRLMRIAGELH